MNRFTDYQADQCSHKGGQRPQVMKANAGTAYKMHQVVKECVMIAHVGLLVFGFLSA